MYYTRYLRAGGEVLAPSHPVLCSPRLRRQRWSPALGVRSAPRGGDRPHPHADRCPRDARTGRLENPTSCPTPVERRHDRAAGRRAGPAAGSASGWHPACGAQRPGPTPGGITGLDAGPPPTRQLTNLMARGARGGGYANDSRSQIPCLNRQHDLCTR